MVYVTVDSIFNESLSVFSPLLDVFHDCTFVTRVDIRVGLIDRFDERQKVNLVFRGLLENSQVEIFKELD